MTHFYKSLTPFWGRVSRSVPKAANLSEESTQAELAGPVNLDVYLELLKQNRDTFIEDLIYQTELAGRLLNRWTDDEARAFRTSAWRSAHRFLVANVDHVDRSRELLELTRILKVEVE